MNNIHPPILEQFTRVFSEIPFNRILGLTLDSIESDHIIIRFIMKEELIGNYMHGILHGGVISSVLDMAGGTTAMLSAIYKRPEKNLEELSKVLSKSSTINLHIDYIRPGKGMQFIAKAWTLHSGNKITFTRMELHNHEETLIATGTGTYLVS